MPMPKASVDEDDFAPSRESEVWDAREIASMQTEAITERVYETTDDQFWPGVRAANPRHVLRPLCWRDYVHRQSRLREDVIRHPVTPQY
jgi:hypothetical protein